MYLYAYIYIYKYTYIYIQLHEYRLGEIIVQLTVLLAVKPQPTNQPDYNFWSHVTAISCTRSVRVGW